MSSMNATTDREPYNLFDDPRIKDTFNGLPKEQQEEYKRQGEHMYSRDYENDNIGSEEDKMIDAAAFISEGLKSGLRPGQLDENEVEVMRSIFGSEWYRRFYYTSEKD